MSLLPQVRNQLLDAAFPPQPRRGGFAGAFRPRQLSLAASLLVSLGIAALLVFGLHGSGARSTLPSNPTPASVPRAWVDAMLRISDQPCRPRPRQPVRRRYLSDPAPDSVTSIIPSLATPPPAAHRVTIADLRRLRIPLQANDIYIRDAWQGEAHGIHYYVIPAGLVGQTSPEPYDCYIHALLSFEKEAQAFPAAQRRAANAWAKAQFTSRRGTPGVAIVSTETDDTGASYLDLERLRPLRTTPSLVAATGGNGRRLMVPVLVADDVASVTLRHRSMSVTEHPYRNLVVFHVPRSWVTPQGLQLGISFRRGGMSGSR